MFLNIVCIPGWTTAIPQNIPENSSVASQNSSKPAVKGKYDQINMI